MCGLAGVFDFNRSIVPESCLKEMGLKLRHRGPDALGVTSGEGIGLVHTRLSILDLSTSANQPMISKSGRYTIVFNGEIYNFADLRRSLEVKGVVFSTSGDTEVVLEGYERFGETFLDELNGMFAIVIYDRKEHSLCIARDRHGVKPIFLARYDGGVAFASEIDSLFSVPALSKKLDWSSLGEYLHYGVTLGSNTLLKGVEQIQPGNILSFDKNGVETKSQILNNVLPDGKVGGYKEAVLRVREELEAAVCRQLVSDVPVGVFLSGGVDSSAIAAFASKHYGSTIQTFSAGYDFSGGVDELPAAREFARRIGTDHHELNIKGGEIADSILSLVSHHGKPFSDAANIPLFLLAKQLGGNPKVILQGDGGDELFGGYHRYQRACNQKYLRLLAPLSGLGASFLPNNHTLQRISRNISALNQSCPALIHAQILSQEPRDRDPFTLLSAEARDAVAGIDPFIRYRQIYQGQPNTTDLADLMMKVDQQIILPDLYFEKVDRATMAASIEVRVPFMDNNLVDLANSLPRDYKVTSRCTKRVLKRALEPFVPKAILYGPKKGFGVPMSYWLRTSLLEFVNSSILSDKFLNLGIVEVSKVRKLVDDHVTGRKDNGFMLFKLMNLALWIDLFNVEVWHEES